ncbi:hypothetical protein [Rhodopirellula sp. MGV]|uniref:hypothetical protein n=1 Tax=Rhodopirellula sp. MGV TaxID=2023130 RepID=UPI000B972B61|nr:hypothetical protein [Rhodopirellula sp. MGV]OYP28395.1 hypothetical protein CGZ80_26655 [Rhodopirellula sp. MGV]PNY38730.1 hypothetical protein C2E31_02135 [Rhodopirellula baltica]
MNYKLALAIVTTLTLLGHETPASADEPPAADCCKPMLLHAKSLLDVATIRAESKKAALATENSRLKELLADKAATYLARDQANTRLGTEDAIANAAKTEYAAASTDQNTADWINKNSIAAQTRRTIADLNAKITNTEKEIENVQLAVARAKLLLEDAEAEKKSAEHLNAEIKNFCKSKAVSEAATSEPADSQDDEVTPGNSNSTSPQTTSSTKIICPDELRKKLLEGQPNVPAAIEDFDTTDKDVLLHRLVNAVMRAQTLRAQVEEIHDQVASLQKENDVSNSDIQETVRKIHESVQERLHWMLLIQKRLERIKPLASQLQIDSEQDQVNCGNGSYALSCDSLCTVKNNHQEVVERYAEIKKLNESLEQATRESISDHLRQLSTLFKKYKIVTEVPAAPKAESTADLLRKLWSSPEALSQAVAQCAQSALETLQSQRAITARAIRDRAAQESPSIEPRGHLDVEVLLLNDEYKTIAKHLAAIEDTRLKLRVKLLACDEVSESYVNDIATQLSIILTEVSGTEANLASLQALDPTVAVIERLIAGDHEIFAQINADDHSKRLAIIQQIRLELAELERQRIPSGNKIADHRLLEQLGDIAVDSCRNLRHLYQHSSDGLVALTEHHQSLHQLSQELDAIVIQCENQQHSLEIKKENTDLIRSEFDRMIAEAHAISECFGSSLHTIVQEQTQDAKNEEYIRSLRLTQQQLLLERAQKDAEMEEKLAQMQWKVVQANMRAKSAKKRNRPDSKTVFNQPARFPIPRYKIDGAPDGRDGLTIAGGMKLITRADGTYEVTLRVSRTQVPVTIRLQLELDIKEHALPVTIVLPPKHFGNHTETSPFASYLDKSLDDSAAGMQGQYAGMQDDQWYEIRFTGSHDALKETGGEIRSARRKGSVTFGHGYQGLDVYSASY